MFVRASKFRNVYGNAFKKENCYEGLHFTQSTHDGCFCAVNPQFLAVVIESAGGGAFVVLPLHKVATELMNVYMYIEQYSSSVFVWQISNVRHSWPV